MGSYCIRGAVKQGLRRTGICSSPLEQLWCCWQLHRAGYQLLFALEPGGELVWGPRAPCHSPDTTSLSQAGCAGGTAVLLVDRQLSLTCFCCTFAAAVLLSDPKASTEVPRAESFPAAASWGLGAAAGEGHPPPARAVPRGARPPSAMAFACRVPAGERQSPNPSSGCGEPGEHRACSPPASERVHMEGMFVYTHTRL